MITDKILLENGYNECEVNKLLHPYANGFFQKRIRNEKGQTRYFINFYKYIHKDKSINYEIDLQFEKDKYTMNMILFAIDENMTLKEIEQEVYAIWYGLDCKYYDYEG